MRVPSHARTVGALLEATAAGTLEAFIGERRALNVGYERIARDLYEATDGAVDVTGATIRNWDEALQADAERAAS